MKFREYIKEDTAPILVEQPVQNLVQSMHKVLADSYGMYFQAQSYHWNVEGMFFSMFHDFFGNIYQEVQGSIDVTAEQIRYIEGYAPISLNQIVAMSSVSVDSSIPNPIQMVQNLLQTNTKVEESLNNAFRVAESAGNQALMDYIASRLDAHAKHGWMLKSTLKTVGE